MRTCGDCASSITQGAGRLGAVEVETFDWFDHQHIANASFAQTLMQRNQLLNHGEAEAIVLALELKADRLLIDETQARMTARAFGIPIRGLLGVLIEAKHQGLIPLVKPVLDDLRTIAHFFVAQSVYDQTLRNAGE